MFQARLFTRKLLVVAALVAVAVLTATRDGRAALIDIGPKHYDADSDTSSGHFVDTDTGEIYEWWYSHETGEGDVYQLDLGNPSPDGGSTGLAPEDMEELLEDLLKIGGSLVAETDFWGTPLGQSMTQSGKGPAVIDPWDNGLWMNDPLGGGGGGSGFDPSVPFGEQIGKKKQQGRGQKNDDDGDDGRPSDPGPWDAWNGYPADPELVNPVPVR